jgi:tetratricopeptide (TPR) repeat protein
MQMISDEKIKNEYSNAKKLLSLFGYKHNVMHKEIFAGKVPLLWKSPHPGGCARHMSVFEILNVIPRYCFSCYKVSIKPRTVVELFKLMMVFEAIEFKNNNTRKCTVETREDIQGTYTGLIYCENIEDANDVLEIIKAVVSVEISADIPIALKRGCSEFPLAYPEYAEIENDVAVMPYNEEWKEQEDEFDEKHSFNESVFLYDTCSEYSNYEFKKAIVQHSWLQYAATIGDLSYLEISGSKVLKLPNLNRPSSGCVSESFKKAEEIKSISVQDVFTKAYNHQKAGNNKKAKLGFLSVLEKEPDHLNANYLLGILATQEGDYVFAKHLLNKVLSSIPESAEANFNMANVYFGLNEFDEAICFYLKAIKSRPDYIKALINIGMAYKGLRQFDKAIEYIEKALLLDQDNAMACNSIGIVYSECNRLDDALLYFNKAIHIASDFSEAYNNLASYYIKKENFERAIVNCNNAIAISPNFSDAYLNLGDACLKAGRTDEAIINFEHVLLLVGDSFKAHNGLGCALKKSDRHEEAVVQFKKALIINSGFTEAEINIDNIYT